MEKSRKLGIIALVAIGVAIFGYAQYASASHISVNMIDSKLLSTDESGSEHSIELEFDNPSLLILTAGETKFEIKSDGETVSEGVLEPFTLTPLNKAQVSGTYYTDNADASENNKDASESNVLITGETTYDMLFVSIGIPFEYQPTDEQARGFIHQS